MASGAAGSHDFDQFTEAGDSQLAGQSILWKAAGFLPRPLAMPIPLVRQNEQEFRVTQVSTPVRSSTGAVRALLGQKSSLNCQF